MPAINLTTPITVPSATYPLVALKSLNISWGNLNKPVTASYALQPYKSDTVNNVTTLTESPTPQITGSINDLLGLATSRAAAGKPHLATAVAAVLTALQEIEHEKGHI